jgi:hypothetical protein
MTTNPSDRIGTFDDAYVDFEVWGEDGERIGLSGPLYLTHNDRPQFVSVRFPDEGTLALVPYGAAEVDEEISMIRLAVPARVTLNAPRMRDDAVPEDEYVRNVMRHFDVAERIETAGPSDGTPTV